MLNNHKTLYKIELRLLKIIPMILAFTALLNSILSYFTLNESNDRGKIEFLSLFFI